MNMEPETQGDMFSRWKHNWSRNSFVISLMVHGLFILLAVLFVAIHQGIRPDGLKIQMNVSKLQPPPKKLDPRPKTDGLSKPSFPPTLKMPIVSVKQTDWKLPPIDKPQRDPNVILINVTSVQLGKREITWGPMDAIFDPKPYTPQLPPVISARCNPQDRFRLLRMNGGKEEVDRAVTRALGWFKANQNADGSWGENDFQTAMTGFALLAFMGRCETDKSPAYGSTVNKAIHFLVQTAQENEGNFYTAKAAQGGWDASGRVGEHFPYAQALGVLGLSETLSLTQRTDIRPVLEEAVQQIIDGQNKDNGGWAYSYATKGAMDLSVSIWQIQALKAAKLAGIRNPGLEPALRKAIDELAGLQQSDGSFPYRSIGAKGKNDSQRGPMTGAALLVLQLDGRPIPRDVVRKGVDYILANDRLTDPKQQVNLYHWYYNTYAVFLSKDRWPDWNNMFQEYILSKQAAAGNWPPMHGTPYFGGGTGPNWETYRTAFCTLMLEVYYRYLPGAKS
jgi:hypothetical protein